MPSKFNKYITPCHWIHIKFNSYEYAKLKERQRMHKLKKREFVRAFLAEQEKRQMENEIDESERNKDVSH